MEIEKKPTTDIIKEMTELDQQIDLKQLKITKLKLELKQLRQELKIMLPKYEELRLEIIKRYPGLKDSGEFKQKNKTI